MKFLLRMAGALFFAVLIGLIFLIGIFLHRSEVKRLQKEEVLSVNEALHDVATSLKNRMYENIHKVSGVKSLVALDPELTQEGFSRAMSVQFDDRGDFRNIGLARDMVLQFVYPVEGNEAAIGLDYRKLPDQLTDVYLAMESREIVLAGPLELVQGGQGFIARIPIYIPDAVSGEEVFWGFASVVMNSDTILEHAGFSLPGGKIRLALRGRNARGDQGEVFWGDPEVFESDPLTETIGLPYGSWQVGAVPVQGWRSGPAGFTPLLLSYGGGSFLLVGFAGLILFLLGRQRRYLEALEMERNLYAEGPVWHMEWDPHPPGGWRLRYVSSNVEEILGFSGEELLAEAFSFESLIHPEDRARVLETLKNCIRDRRDRFDEGYRLYTKEGCLLWVYDYTMLIRDANGTLTGIRSYMYDQTARIEAERALKLAEQRLEKTAYELTENIPVGTYTMVQPPEGGIGKFCFMSSRFLELTGLTREVAERDPLEAFGCVHPDDYAQWVALNAEAFEKGSAFFGETRVVVNGTVRWIRAESKPRSLADGTVVWEGALTDITEMKEAGQALRESVNRFNDLVSYVSVGVYVLWMRADGSMECEYVSDGWCAMTGLSREEVMADWGAAIRTIHPEEREAFVALHHEVYTKRKPFVWEGRVLLNEGFYYARIQSNPVFFENGDTRWFGVHQDISEYRLMENKLIAAGKRAEAASVAKSRFLASMSHELRTPLNGVTGFSELLADTELTAEQQEYLDCIQVCSKTLLTLISDILDFSKIEADMMDLECVRTDMSAIYEDCMDIVRFTAVQKGLDLRLEVVPDCPAFAELDPMRLKQILINLLGNAVKFTESGEVVLEVSYESGDEGTGRFWLAVRDTGIGIRPSETANLFKPFFQADSSTTRRFGGTGLGLAISSMLAEKLGSGIRVESTPGVGSIFRFDVAVGPASASESAGDGVERHPDIAIVPQRLEDPSILLAEDVLMNRIMMKALLVKRIPGIQIFEAENGARAVELYLEKHPHLILMDVQMPEMDGLEATRRIREMETHRQRVPVVVLTAGASQEEQDAAFLAGVDDYLAKPLVPAQLDAVLAKYGFSG